MIHRACDCSLCFLRWWTRAVIPWKSCAVNNVPVVLPACMWRASPPIGGSCSTQIHPRTLRDVQHHSVSSNVKSISWWMEQEDRNEGSLLLWSDFHSAVCDKKSGSCICILQNMRYFAVHHGYVTILVLVLFFLLSIFLRCALRTGSQSEISRLHCCSAAFTKQRWNGSSSGWHLKFMGVVFSWNKLRPASKPASVTSSKSHY